MNNCIPKKLDLTKIIDERGKLTFIEGKNHIPFEIKRVFYIYDIHTGSYRGAHAHKNLHQLMISLSGSFEILLDNSKSKNTHYLNDPSKGLYIPPGHWTELCSFSSGAVCLVLASDIYQENDYIRDYDEFIKYKEINENKVS